MVGLRRGRRPGIGTPRRAANPRGPGGGAAAGGSARRAPRTSAVDRRSRAGNYAARGPGALRTIGPVTVRRRLASSSVLIALAAVLVLGVPLGIVESARVRSDENGRLEREADAVAGVIDDRIERRQPVTS